MLEAGTYRAKASTWQIGEAKTGTPQIVVSFDLLDFAGQAATWYGYLSEKALATTVKALRACGWGGLELAELADGGGGLDANEVFLVVEHEEYEGTVRAKVRWVNSGNGAGFGEALPTDKLKAFSALMRGKIAGVDPASAKKAAAAKTNSTKPKPAAGADDDIPF